MEKFSVEEIEDLLVLIKSIIKDNGDTIGNVAKKINVSRSCLSDRLNGDHLIIDALFEELCGKLGIDVQIVVKMKG